MKTNPSLSDVAARSEQLEREIEERRLELSELAVAARVLRRLGEYALTPDATIDSVPRRTPPVPPPVHPVPPIPPKFDAYAVDPTKESVESLILIVLGASRKAWWTANELQAELSRLKGTEVPMSTISPTLTNMKNNGKIHRDGFRVADLNRVRQFPSALDLLEANSPPQNENGEAKASPETGELAGSPNDNSA